MRTLLTKTLIAAAVLACSWTGARAGVGVRVGIGIGVPYPYYGHYYRPYYGYPYYYGPAVVVAPAPTVIAAPPPTVIVQPAPAAVQPAPSSYQPAPAPPPTLPAPTPVSAAASLQAYQPAPLAPAVARAAAPDDVERVLQMLNDPGEGARASAAMQLGRGKVQQAVAPLSKVLNDDSSPRVRDAAARALGLIASPSSLNVLQTAAQADDDREVRHSAQFAAEVIRTNLRR